MDKNKLILPISILLGCLILGGFIYASQLSKQNSIEKQQEIQLRANKEIDELKDEQNKLNDEEREKEAISLFEKQTECQTYKSKIEQDYNNETSVSVFYSSYKNTCVYENIGAINRQITSKMLADVFTSDAYVLEQNGKIIYDEKEFGPDQSYSDIERILKDN